MKCVNALNGLFSFLPGQNWKQEECLRECQRPERAFFISTTASFPWCVWCDVCQRPERAFFISTLFRMES